MFKKILSAAAALCITCSAISPISLAAESSFSDVISPDYDWAMEEIEEMTTLGIIKGYTDGTFRPANTIRKIEALLLLARAAGYSNVDYEPFATFAMELYGPILDEYDLGSTYNEYKNEVAFLLYRDVLNIEDLDTYLEDASSGLLRYEAAILLTKLMGAEDEVAGNTAVVLDYSDYTDIPVSARPYVEYVTQQGLMMGLEDNRFGPNEDVTRVQVTILLSRILDALDYTTITGTVRNVNSADSTITIYDEETSTSEEYAINSSRVSIKKDGFNSNLSSIETGSRALLLYSGNELTGLEVLSLSSEEEETVSGRLADITERTNYISFYVIDDDAESSREFFILSQSEPEVTYNDSESSFSRLSSGDFVTVTVRNGAVVSIEAQTGDLSVTGTIRDITLSPDYSLTVRLNDENGTSTNETVEYSVSDDVSVRRNSSRSSLRDLLVGDRVSLTVEGGLVTEIDATSTTRDTSGTISSISISSESQIGIRSDGSEDIYPVSPDATYIVGGNEATIYDLRLGASVEVTIESDTITSVTAAAASSTYQKSGIIEDINTSYGFINLNIDGGFEQIFVSKTGNNISATIIDSSTGNSINFSRLERNQMITAVGSYVNGAFVATTIIVIPSAE